MNLVIKHNDL